MIGFGVITVGILLQPEERNHVVGLAAALLELVVGVPHAIATTVDLGRFSLFSLAPIFSNRLTSHHVRGLLLLTMQ